MVGQRATLQRRVRHSANVALGSLKDDFKSCCITGNLDDTELYCLENYLCDDCASLND